MLVACLIWVFYRQVNRPVHELAQGCEQVRDGKLTFDVPPMRTSEFQLLSDGFSTMLGRIRKLIDENYRQKILVQQMELKQLHAKVNPHFLHNSLLNIRAMAQLQDYEGIEDMTEKLSKFIFMPRAPIGKLWPRARNTNTRSCISISSPSALASAFKRRWSRCPRTARR